MEINKTKPKTKSRLRNKAQKRSEDEESNADLDVEPRVVLTPVKGRSRSSSTSSVETVDTTRTEKSGKKQNRLESSKTYNGESTGNALADLAVERKELEKFLFDETNKVNKTAIKFILEKWAAMETRLQSALVENKVLQEKCKYVESRGETMSYAQAAAMRKHVPRPPLAEQRKNISPPKERYEVVLIRPEKQDKRNNEEIKEEILKGLNKVRKNIKVRGVKQMRKQGVVVEVLDQKDVDIIKSCDLKKAGFVIERPRKINPSLIIYDVEKEYNEEELKEDLIRKNLDHVSESEIEEIRNTIKFVHKFKTKDERRVNWIVQLPTKYYMNLSNKGRVFLMWRTYRVKEYINITRCYKCHGYGHVAKICNTRDQLCYSCGSHDHLRKNCPKKSAPECINCTRARRKEVKHEVHSRECPEYKRQLDLYNNRISWD